ncbi:MAG: NADH-quinone oxidoreductase subunit L [Candidatus Heimdallarchaeota archaeon]|nr:MAG: NADH-quinone oxidoreductase subunit L [Candidatus Heimdallarchaeota archaeon]
MAEEIVLGNLAFLIWLIPILASFIVLFFGRYVDKKAHGNLIALIAMGTSLILTLIISGQVLLLLFQQLIGEHHVEYGTPLLEKSFPLLNWIEVGSIKLELGVLIDPLSAIVSLMVSFVAFLVVVYSRSYMSHEGSPRYYAEILLFSAAMLGLVFSPNFIQLFLFWEIMGVCSYLLIGYFYDKEVVPEGQPHPASAAKKAFLTTKVGDVFLFVGIILLWVETHTFDFIELRDAHGIEPGLLVLIALCIFGGAVGKSAQFPLHVWLPDAMAGPTTVSCLIHSATMVKAGIFLVARSFFILFEHSEEAMLIVAVIGGITAIMAGTIALVKTDIKGVLAYSTISQLGYMTIGLGVGGMAVAVFHIINHGIFKALLFLSAGSVIHGSGTQDIREMGGLREKMPHTWKVMLIGSLSLAGIGNGFFSKDAIILHTLYKAQHSEYGSLIMLVWLFSVITAFLTAFYIFRMWFLVFPGTNRNPGHHIHESDPWMTVPLWSLAILSLVLAGIYLLGHIPVLNVEIIPLLNIEHHLVEWLEGPWVHELPEIGPDITFLTQLSSILLAILGIGLAYMIYYPRSKAQVSFIEGDPSFNIVVSESSDPITKIQVGMRSFVRRIKISPPGRGIQRVLEKGYYIDDLFLGFVYFVYEYYCEAMNWIERNILDGAVRFTGRVGYELCGLSKWWDDHVIDGLVRLTAKASVALCGLAKATDERVIDHGIIRNSAKGVMKTGGYLRRIQTGVVENYALYTLLGAITLILVAIIAAGVVPL